MLPCRTLLLALLCPLAALAAGPHPERLRCEYRVDPLGIQEASPRLSWVVDSDRRGEAQTAYEVQVASRPALLDGDRADLWSTGRVPSGENSQIPYRGKALGSRQACFWRVRVWDRDGKPGPWSGAAHWEMGLLGKADWSAAWIGSPFSKPSLPQAAPLLRGTVDLPVQPLAKARLYVSALGLYEFRINGQRVGDAVLAPDWTDYRKRVQYQVFDVTPLLHAGSNTLGAMLSAGWYAGRVGLGGHHVYGKTPALLAQLEVTLADGRRIVTGTGEAWRSLAGPIRSADLLEGEQYDARREVPGWDQPGLDDHAWLPVQPCPAPAGALEGAVADPVRVLTQLPARTVTRVGRHRWIFDLGQNMVGVVRLKVQAEKGTRVTLRHGEMLDRDGSLYVKNLRGIPCTDRYVCRGGGAEVWQPRFTFHGFRYVEVSGDLPDPGPEMVTGMVIGSDTPRTGTFTCSDARINQLQSNIQWGQRGNFLSVPTDCPQRDERLGWMGDAEVFARTAALNADVAAFFTKWMMDVDDAQRADGRFSDVSPDTTATGGAPGWGDAGVIVPWTCYEMYGDTRILERHLPAMCRWVDWMKAGTKGLIREGDRGNDFGDWLAIGAETSQELIGTAFFAHSVDLVGRACGVLGREAEAARYRALFQDIRTAFQGRYLDATGAIREGTQTAYLLALAFDLLPEAGRAHAADLLEADLRSHQDHLTTGFLGVSHLLPELTRAGRTEEAFRLLVQDTFPSWLFPVKHGATTIWERWDGWTPEKGFQDPGMNSFNHYSLGSCGQWLFEGVAGIGQDPQVPAFRHILLEPRVGGGLASAKASLETLRGRIESAWSVADGVLTYECRVPVGSTATLTLPTRNPAEVTEGGQPLEGVTLQGTGCQVTLGSGTYRFRCPLAR